MSTASVFDSHYLRYDRWYLNHPILAENEYKTVKTALKEAGKPCLEIGVGTGWFASRLDCLGGIDPSMNMLLVARNRGLEVIRGRGEALPLASESIPTLLMVVTLCFVDHPAMVLREAYRSLVPGGLLVVCIVPRDSSWGEYYMEEGRRGHPFYSIARFYTVEELDSMAFRVGFLLESRIASITFTPFDDVRREYPRPYKGGEGFVCSRYRRSRINHPLIGESNWRR